MLRRVAHIEPGGAARHALEAFAVVDALQQRLAQQLLEIALAEAAEKVRRGALWLDVRYPSEYQYDKLPGAINVPVNEVRNMFAVLDRSKEYIVYCQSGRRSSAAAFLFAQHGFRACLLEGGLWGAGRGR